MATVPSILYQPTPGNFLIVPISSIPFTDGLTTPLQASVANPAVGSATIFVNAGGDLSLNDSSGSVFTYVGNPADQDINLNGHNLANAAAVQFAGDIVLTKGSSDNVNIGGTLGGSALSSIAISGFSTGAQANGSNQIVIGSLDAAAAGAQYATIIGNSINSFAGPSTTIGGGTGPVVNRQANSFMFSDNATLAAGGSGGIALGSGAGIGAVSNAMSLGVSAVNNTASSCLIGDPAVANIRANSLVCDLGTSAVPFASARLGALRLVTGANKTVGSGATLAGAGTVTVATTAVNAGDIVLLSRTAVGGTTGQAYISAIVDATSFTITSDNALDTSTFSWVIVKQA